MRRLHTAIAVAALLAGCTATRSGHESKSPTSPSTPAHPVCAAIRSAGERNQPPTEPVTVPVVGSRLRVFALGDFGDGSAGQQAVADAMNEYRARHPDAPASFGLTLGDNFYEEGLRGGRRILWKELWEDKYARLGLLFFATLGNHDYDDVTPRQELDYSSQSWCLPRHYYTFKAGTVQFFALDTEPLGRRSGDADQLAWLDRALRESSARWKVVYGHHPILSNGRHGDDAEIALLRDRLLPRLRNRATIYLAGHDHDLQRLALDGIHLFVAGAGGHKVRPLRRKPSGDQWGVGSTPGFAVLEATEQQLVIQLLDLNQSPLCTFSIDQTGQSDDTGCRRR